MDLIFYATAENGYYRKLLANIETVIPRENVAVCRTVEELTRSLLRPLDELLAVVLLIRSVKELLLILPLHDVLHTIRVILVLPDSHRDTLANGHILRPRFMTCIDDDCRQIAAVLAKMMLKAELA